MKLAIILVLDFLQDNYFSVQWKLAHAKPRFTNLCVRILKIKFIICFSADSLKIHVDVS